MLGGIEMEPLSMVTTILAVVHLIGKAAVTARQNKQKCLELAGRSKNLGEALPNFAKVAANDEATVHGLERLHEALDKALKVIDSCKDAGIWSGFAISGKAADLDNINMTINNCLSDLNFFSLASRPAMSAQNVAPAAASVPAQTYDYSSYYQSQGEGGPSSVHAAWSPPTPQHAWSPQPGYHQQAPGYAHWVPSPASPYTAYPAPSGSKLPSYCTLPTVNKIVKRVCNGFR